MVREKYYFLDGKIIPARDAKIPIGDIAIGRGYGTFDYFQVIDGVPMYREEHLERFFRSCQLMRLSLTFSQEEVSSYIDELLVINQVQSAGVKLIATGGVSPDGFSLSKPSLAIQILPYFEPDESAVKAGVTLLSYEYQRLLPHIKSTNYLYNVFLSDELKEAGAIEPLYYTAESVRETARANIFAVINGVLITPGEKVLPGINRQHVLDLGFPCEIKNITLEALKKADEVFLTGTTKRAVGVVKIDDSIISNGVPGPITTEIRRRLLAAEKKKIDTYIAEHSKT